VHLSGALSVVLAGRGSALLSRSARGTLVVRLSGRSGNSLVAVVTIGVVDVGDISLDGVVVLVVLVNAGVHIDIGGLGERVRIVVSRGATKSGAAAAAARLAAGCESAAAEGTDGTSGGTIVDLLDGLEVKVIMRGVNVGCVHSRGPGTGRSVGVRVRVSVLGVGRMDVLREVS
jgi:hypothetical protein